MGKWEVGDDEWREEIKQGLEVSGLVPGIQQMEDAEQEKGAGKAK